MSGPMRKYICEECDHQAQEEQLLRAQNPFADDTDTIIGCPNCREVNTMAVACDEPDCWDVATCGTTTPAGYRRVCGNHFRVLSAAARIR
jgi:DNA-directed RNA polymerase subunit RPC12/RpoP